MAMIPLCRVCLSDNVMLCSVNNDHLINVYEKLTDCKFKKVGYPVAMCYLCLSVLRKCHRFMETAQDSNRVLEQWYNGETDVKLKKQVLYNYTTHLTYTTSFGSQSDINIKTENSRHFNTSNITSEQTPESGNISQQDNQNGNSIVSKKIKTEFKDEDYIFNSKFKKSKVNNGKTIASTSSKISSEDISLSSISRKRKKSTVQHNETKPKKRLTEKSEALHKIISSDLRTNSSKPFTCKICNFKCHTKHLLNRHLKIHGEKLFSCSICDYKCSNKTNLNRHFRIHTQEKPFSCDLCEFKCTSNDVLITHYRTHTDERLFSCSVCNFQCSKSCNLLRHMRTHSSNKSYSCHLCGYKCSQRSNLKNHIRCHVEEKLLSCDQCDQVIKSLFALCK